MSEYNTPAEKVKDQAVDLCLKAITLGDEKLGNMLTENKSYIFNRVLYYIHQMGLTDYAALVVGSKKHQEELKEVIVWEKGNE